jgi:mRNA-degrading endonuclease toxin of MazEF toxin-antitoxin module
MARGDVVWVNFAGQGHQQAGYRPAIVVGDNPAVPVVTVIPLTGQTKALRFPATVEIRASQHNGLRQNSVALVFQIISIDRQQIQGDSAGQLEAHLLEAIEGCLVRHCAPASRE